MKHFSLAIIVGALFGTSGLHAQIASAHIGESKQMYTSIKVNLMAMADKMPEEDYSFKPTADIRSFGQIVAHVADVQARFCSPPAVCRNRSVRVPRPPRPTSSLL